VTGLAVTRGRDSFVTLIRGVQSTRRDAILVSFRAQRTYDPSISPRGIGIWCSFVIVHEIRSIECLLSGKIVIGNSIYAFGVAFGSSEELRYDIDIPLRDCMDCFDHGAWSLRSLIHRDVPESDYW
jgi:hypothetical protein